MLKLGFTILIGLVGAALLHLVIILALPHFTGLDAYTRVIAKGEPHRFYILGEKPDATGLADSDPYVQAAVCPFDISDLPVRLQARGAVPFWSMVIYDSSSNEVFSMNDRTSVGGLLDVVVASPVQLTTLRKALPEALEQSILVDMPRAEGYAVVRTMAPRKSLEDAAHAFLAGASCEEFSGP